METKYKIMLGIGALACLALSIICLYKIINLINLKKKAVSCVQATVVNYRTHENSDKRTSYHPIFHYHIAGKEYTDPYEFGFNYPYWEINSQVTLKYNPDNPLQYYIEGFNFRKTYILLFVGFFLGLGFVIMLGYCVI